MTYDLKLNDENGPMIQQVDKNQPFVFLYGVGNMLPKFEDNLKDMKAGDNYEFKLTSEEGYGERREDAIMDLNKSMFSVEAGIDENQLTIGNYLEMADKEGNPILGKIVEVKEDVVKMDFNHPLAGADLHFQGEILDVREATSEELEHGHAHGPGGAHH